MCCNPLKVRSLSILLLLFTVFSLHAQPSAEEGKTLFRNTCAACHNKNMKADLTGPALGGTEENWADYPREDLYLWIRNSQGMIADGHPKAMELWNKWKPVVMIPNPDMTDEQIESIMLYIDQEFNKAPDVVITTGAGSDDKSSKAFLYWTLFAILIVVSVVLWRIIGNLNHIAAVNAGETPPEQKTLFEKFTSKGAVSFLIFVLVILGFYNTAINGIAFGRQQGYAPEQPINFSHAVHAGEQGIDCQYCHDGARRSRHSVIPSANTCMNCHRAVKSGSTYGTAEITKIFASIGYDPSTDKYIENYNTLSEDTIKTIYTKWIEDQYLATSDKTELDSRGNLEVKNQWEGIKSSLTNEFKSEIPGPIEWVRIHHLPDHVTYNHSQHVTVGKLECQQCHGKVEEMEVLQQYAPLSMGWCVNCHRQTEVQFAGNEYYEAYGRYHDELASGVRDKVTVEDIGGLECQKCHY
ncbi:MAG: cytochrome c class I [Bacteroidetes bacterium]|nr:MAG: cytochrome c class I [Bacteroidota bacterium]